MRGLVVVLLAGCLGRPALRDRDGGSEGDGGGPEDGATDGAMGDGGTFDSPLAGCSWTWRGVILDGANDERHPWISSDGLTVIYWTGDAPGNPGVMMQARRASLSDTFMTPAQVFPQVGMTAPGEADPAFTNDLTKMYIHINSSIQSVTRAMPDGVFQTPATDPELAAIGVIRDVQDGGFLTSDGRTFVFAAGDSVDTYDSEDLYIATRAGMMGPFGTAKPYEHNVAGVNEGAPTMAGNVLMFERPSTNGKTEIVSSILNGTSFSPPEPVVLQGTDSFKQPSLSADGRRLVYGVSLGNDYHLEESELTCP